MSPLSGVLAHGVGTRADLPLPVGYVVVGGGLAVLASFLVLLALWRTPRLSDPDRGRLLPRWCTSVADSRWLRGGLCALVLGVSAVVLAVGLFGPPEVPRNLAPWVLYVTFWVGLVPISLLLGPVWRVVNPLRTVHAGLRRIVGPGRPEGLERLGLWPAALFLAAFAWLELAAPERSDPRRVGAFLLGYAVLQLALACRFGAGWFARGDGFEVYSTLLGSLSLLGRRADGRLVLRNPLRGAAALTGTAGMPAVVLVLVGSTAFDGLSRTRYWQDGPGVDGDTVVLPATLGLTGCVLVVSALYVVACRLSDRLTGTRDAAVSYAHTLIPIAAGYTIAHYFSLLLLDGQTTYILASDPFGTGANLFGTSGQVIDYTVVSARVISLVQAGAIVVGHVIAAVLAHERGLLRGTGNRTTAGQLPLLTVMIVFTLAGLGLLLGG